MIFWIITSCLLYALSVAIALFLIASGDDRGKDAYFDIRNIGVAVVWPVVLAGHGLWLGGKRIFKEKTKTEDNGTDTGIE